MTTLESLLSITDFEQQWMANADRAIGQYVAGGAGSDSTVAANVAAFDDVWLQPRGVLSDCPVNLDPTVTLFGQQQAFPVVLAPTSPQRLVHPQAELATARAAGSRGVVSIVSTDSHYPYSDIAETAPSRTWFQLFAYRSRRDIEATLEFAESCGTSAIVVTVDTFVPGWKPRDLQQAWLPFLNGMGVGNYFQDPVFRAALEQTPEQDQGAATGHFLGVQANPSLSWDDLARLREMTSLPILVKGIQSVEDAREALRRGLDGIVVSNHGGRQVDGAIAALDALPPIVDAVGGRTTVLFDSGIRRGPDVIKAMALGARCVLLGRPYAFGLAVDGEKGVREVLENLVADIDLTLGLSGCSSFAELGRENLVEVPYPPSVPEK